MRKALLVVLALLLAGLAVWWFWLRVPAVPDASMVAPSIERDLLDAISNDMLNNGLSNEEYLHSNFSALLLLEPVQLGSLKQSLQQRESVASGPAEKSLLESYVQLTDLAVEMQKLNDLSLQMENLYDICEQQELVRDFTVQLEKTNELYRRFGEQSDSFTNTFWVDAENIDFFPLSDEYQVNFERNRALIEENKAALELCS